MFITSPLWAAVVCILIAGLQLDEAAKAPPDIIKVAAATATISRLGDPQSFFIALFLSSSISPR
jgi:hypothetical protein